jgi:hypothetical protein
VGFKAQRKTLNLQFSGDLEGLEIRVGTISFGKLLDLGDQADRLRAGAGLGEVRGLVELFVGRIQSWNLEDEDGEPIKVEVASFLDQDIDLCSAAMLAWVDSMTSVSTSLGKGSTSGQPSAPPNFPMEAF